MGLSICVFGLVAILPLYTLRVKVFLATVEPWRLRRQIEPSGCTLTTVRTKLYCLVTGVYNIVNFWSNCTIGKASDLRSRNRVFDSAWQLLRIDLGQIVHTYVISVNNLPKITPQLLPGGVEHSIS